MFEFEKIRSQDAKGNHEALQMKTFFPYFNESFITWAN